MVAAGFLLDSILVCFFFIDKIINYFDITNLAKFIWTLNDILHFLTKCDLNHLRVVLFLYIIDWSKLILSSGLWMEDVWNVDAWIV